MSVIDRIYGHIVLFLAHARDFFPFFSFFPPAPPLEKIIDDACVKLLILKLLYCIFTRSSLYEYFYTNDLYVLVDVILREVCNLGEERDAEAVSEKMKTNP